MYLKFPTNEIIPFTDEKKRQLLAAILASLAVDPSYTINLIGLTVVPPTNPSGGRRLTHFAAGHRQLQVGSRVAQEGRGFKNLCNKCGHSCMFH